MNLVLGTLELTTISGVGTYLVTVAEELEALGHGVTILAEEAGDMAKIAGERGLRVVSSPDALPESCDAIYAQDAPSAYTLADHYRGVPQAFCAHAWAHDRWLVPQLPGVTSATVALHERAARHVRSLGHVPEVVRLRQPVDTRRFSPRGPIGSAPTRALVLGNYTSGNRLELLREAFSEAGVELVQRGLQGGGFALTPESDINDSDIVVGRARVVVEGMACGRAAYVYDYEGGDGWVTADRYEELEADNFEGHADPRAIDSDRLREDLREYSAHMGPANRELAVANHSVRSHAEELVELFRRLEPRAEVDVASLDELKRLTRMQWRADSLALGFEHEARRLREDLGRRNREQAGLYEETIGAQLSAAEADQRAAAAERRSAEADERATAAEVEAQRAAAGETRAEQRAAAAEEGAHQVREALTAREAEAAEMREEVEGVRENGESEGVELALVVPLEDPRGDIVEHLRTWTHGQTLPRERYQLMVGASDEHPELERQVAELLQPQDQLVIVPRDQLDAEPGAALIGLYDAAARAAEAPILLITEAHCKAEPECLANVAEAFASDPAVDAVTFPHRQNVTTYSGGLTDRWFAGVFEDWERAGWTRLNLTGAAIRTDAYNRAGGLDPRLGLYASSFMSARLHEQGSRVTHLDRGGVSHELEDRVRDGIWMSRSFARGECRARTENDPEFCDRYFGPAGLLERRLAYSRSAVMAMTVALISAAGRTPRKAPWLARELMVRAPALIAGARPRLVWEWASGLWFQAVAAFPPLHAETRWRSYVQAHERTVRAAQLRHIAENGVPDPMGAAVGILGAERLDTALVGSHGLEEHEGRKHRWTEPVSLLRMAPPREGAVLRIETGGLRGDPIAYLMGVYAGSRRLPPDLISSDGETLEAHLPAEFAGAAGERGITLLCEPLVPSRNGSGDGRRLGMPVRKIEIRPA